MNFKEIRLAGVSWIHFSRDGDQWRALTNRVINLGFSYSSTDFLPG